MSDDDADPATGTSDKLTVDRVEGLIDLDFLKHYALIDATRRRAVVRAAAEPLPTPPPRLAVAPAIGQPSTDASEETRVGEAAVPGPSKTPGLSDKKRTPDARPAVPRPSRATAAELPKRRDRRDEILEQLARGPASAHEFAEQFGISREGVLRWLRLLEAEGRIRSTASACTSRTNRWVLADAPDDAGDAVATEEGERTAIGAPPE